MGRPKHLVGRIFFSLFHGCQCISFKFPMGYEHVPQHVIPNTSLECICFGKCCPPLTSVGEPNGRHSILQNRTFYLGRRNSRVSFFFPVMSQ